MMQDEAKISIIIPVYNGARFIQETVHHIQNSTYGNLEIILVNDGSTDNSGEVIAQLQKEDARVCLYAKENGGVVSARNYGVERATGEFLCFCDQDDVVMPETYRKLYEKMQEDESDMAMCTSGRILDGKKSLFDIAETAVYEGEQISENLLFPLLFNGYKVPFKVKDVNRYPHIWNCMFRASFWKENQFLFRANINYEDDLLLKVEALSKAAKVSTVSYVGYYWRVNLKSETYAHKYVKNIGKKQQCTLLDMKRSLMYRTQDEQVLDAFEKVTLCKQYVDAVHNLTSPYQKKTISFVRNYYKKNIYSRNFGHAIKVRKNLKKGRVKPGVLLPLLAHKMTILSFVAEVILDWILLITLHSPALTKLERLIKR